MKTRVLQIAILMLATPVFSLRAQTATPNQIPALEQQLAAAGSPAEKAALCNELSFAWQKKDPVKAVQYARDAYQLANEAGNDKEAMKALNLSGDAVFRQRDYVQAEKYYLQALEQAQKTSDAEMEARATHNRGKVAQQTGNLDKAVEFYEQAYQIRERIGDQAGLSSTVLNLAVLYSQRSEFEKSNNYYQRSLQLKEASGDRPGMATVQANLANNYSMMGRFTDAELLLRSAIQINTEIGNQAGIAQGYLNLGAVMTKMGQSDAGVDCFEKAIALYRSLGDQMNVCGALSNLANCLTDRADYAGAQERFLEALKIAETMPQASGILYDIYQGLGRVKGFQSLHREELEYYTRALPYASTDFMRTTVLLTTSAAYLGDLQFEKAYDVAQEVLQIAREKGFRESEAEGLYHSASALLHLNRLPEALRAIDEAVATAKKIQYQRFLPAALVLRSRLLTRLGENHRAALAAAQQALALAQKTERPLEVAHAWEELAEAYRALNKADKALDALRNSQRIRDSIFNKADIRTMAVQEKEYEFDKERAAQRQEKERIAQQAAIELERQRAQRNRWILGLSGLLALSLLSFFLWRNRQRTRARLREAENRVRIARDLHDDLGSTLSSISILSEAVKQPEIGEKARQAMESMDDIIWSVNPQNDTMANVLQRMKQFAAEMLEPQSIALHFQADESVADLNLPMEQRKDFYLLFKEAVNNAAKYSGASDVWVSVQAENGGLNLEVRDNGRGFDVEQVKRGNGLWNMQRRAERMGGKFELESRVGEGTVVKVKM